MKACVLLLVLLGAFTNAAPASRNYLHLDSADKELFCLTHEEVYAKFRLQMRVGIRHSPLYEPSNMCMLDLESTNLESEYMSVASAEAAGINISVALDLENVQIPFSYVGIGFNPFSKYLYMNVSSWSPWDQLTEDLSKNNSWGIKQLMESQKLFIQVGCDHQKFPEEPTLRPTPSPRTTPSQINTTPDLDEEEEEYEDIIPTPADVNVNRKRNPAQLDFSLITDPRCVESVDLHVELKDACIAYKHKSPLMLRGQYGDGDEVRKEIKGLSNSYNTCSLNLNPDSN
uniref:Chemokine-binding protein n=1 Tax=Pseudocowpox virus TaxID=129726 RepID=G3G9Y4_9POXV|nr:chemokine-binding protein [Pseudocowpox virus]